MSKASNYVKRFKALSLLALTSIVLTYNIVDSRTHLAADYQRTQYLFLATALLKADSAQNGTIARINESAAADWLQQQSEPLPIIGPIVNIIDLWNIGDKQIDGSFTLSNGETYEFSRLPYGWLKNSQGTNRSSIIEHLCILEPETNCHLFDLKQQGKSITSKMLLTRLVDRENQDLTPTKSWKLLDTDKGKLIDVKQIETLMTRIATVWIGSSNDPQDAYFNLRDRLQQQVVRIPIINLDVEVSRASIFLSTFALVCAALMSHSMLNISNTSLLSIDEPWILQNEIIDTSTLIRAIQLTLSATGGAINIILAWCPVVIVGLAMSIATSHILLGIMSFFLIITVVLATVTSRTLFSITAKSLAP